MARRLPSRLALPCFAVLEQQSYRTQQAVQRLRIPRQSDFLQLFLRGRCRQPQRVAPASQETRDAAPPEAKSLARIPGFPALAKYTLRRFLRQSLRFAVGLEQDLACLAGCGKKLRQ